MPKRFLITKMPPWVNKATRALGAMGDRFEDVGIRRKVVAGLAFGRGTYIGVRPATENRIDEKTGKIFERHAKAIFENKKANEIMAVTKAVNGFLSTMQGILAMEASPAKRAIVRNTFQTLKVVSGTILKRKGRAALFLCRCSRELSSEAQAF